MAFEKRNWLARIGVGLNKFFIGDKDSQGKQTLTNAPDSVTQQGDVISADNLNDLEERIANAVDILGWEKTWENPQPLQDFSQQTIDIVGKDEMLIGFYINHSDATEDNEWSLHVAHFFKEETRYSGTMTATWISSNGVSGASRSFWQGQIYSELTFGNASCYSGGIYDDQHANDFMIPVVIYERDFVR